MNKTMVKRTIAIGAAALLLAGALFAKSHKPYPKDRMHEEDFSRDERPMHTEDSTDGTWPVRGKKVPAPIENSIMGDWILREADRAVKVELDHDGSMEIEWLQSFTSSTKWEGFWTATDTEITFTVRNKKTETWTNGVKKEIRENANMTWKIQYTRTADTLTLTGSDLPQELSNLTLSRHGR